MYLAAFFSCAKTAFSIQKQTYSSSIKESLKSRFHFRHRATEMEKLPLDLSFK